MKNIPLFSTFGRRLGGIWDNSTVHWCKLRMRCSVRFKINSLHLTHSPQLLGTKSQNSNYWTIFKSLYNKTLLHNTISTITPRVPISNQLMFTKNWSKAVKIVAQENIKYLNSRSVLLSLLIVSWPDWCNLWWTMGKPDQLHNYESVTL